MPVMRELGLVTTFTDVNFGNAGKIFNEAGELQDESFIKRVRRVSRRVNLDDPRPAARPRKYRSGLTTAAPAMAESFEERMRRAGIREVDLEETFARSAGPGGQNVNKVATAVTLRHRPSGASVTVQDSRSQATNRKLARERLLAAIEREQDESAGGGKGKARESAAAKFAAAACGQAPDIWKRNENAPP